MAQGNEVPARPAGKLKIFFGYAAGVGKTRAMLEAAHRASAGGADVAVGCIAPGTRPETLALLEGLPRVLSAGDGADRTPGSLDLDSALRRQPQLLVVDDLAHTNRPGSRHLKRYQDVEELLRAGINVYTTLNVQQLESLNDIVAGVTGVTVTERIPDHVFDAAAQVELVDLEPSDLAAERQAGRGGTPEKRSGFTEQHLTALREIALRRTADRLGRDTARPSRTKTGEHILICLSSAPSNAKVIRTAARMAEAFHSEFTALFVETADSAGEDEVSRVRRQANLRLAEELGARITTLYGDDPAAQIAEYARAGGVSKIVLGRSAQRRPLLGRRNSLIDRLSVLAPDLDVYIIPDQQTPGKPRRPHRPTEEQFSLGDTGRMLAILGLCTAVGYLFTALGLTTATVIMIYILGVLSVAMATNGRSYSLLASVLSVLIFNFFFTNPYFTLRSDPSYIATFGVMFVVALLSSSLTTRIKRQALESAQKAYRTEVLLETSQKLQKSEGTESILAVGATQLGKLLDRAVLLYPVEEDGTLGNARWYSASQTALGDCLTAEEKAVAEWVWRNNKHAGAGTGTFPDAKCLYMAVRGENRALAVAGIRISGAAMPDAFEKNLMVAILDECGLALEKDFLQRAKQQVEETARQEALRANLLRAISHDLRTPLTSISGNAGILMGNSAVLDERKKRTLYASIYDDAMWLVNLVENLLSVTRIENGGMRLKLQPELLEEVFQEALAHLDRQAAAHQISVDLPDDLLMADMDARLMVQVVINLVNNAVKYTPPGSHIVVSAEMQGKMVLVSVADDGPGVPDAVKEKLFEMFYTADNTRGDGRRGLGLGLSLCKSVVAAHDGAIFVEDNTPRGARFCFTLHASEVKGL
ncbi:MAG: sensor histidine kinase KdpD [Oscillibacter sp.]